jgi:purine-binding chemotaxis protein CheW
MNEYPLLIFKLNDSLYGVNTFMVEEIFFLPEVTPIPEAPRDIVGIVNVMGYILPIMDINLRFGYETTDYNIKDSVIVLRSGDLKLGVVVNEVQEVRNITLEEITSEIAIGRELKKSQKGNFIAGIAKDEADIIIIIEPENLIHYVEKQDFDTSQIQKIEDTLEKDDLQKLEKRRVFCPNATPEQRQIFLKRAENLRQTGETDEEEGLKPLAVVSLNKEFFAIDLKIVREFTEISQLTPIPCCPGHILGNMNLRGEILTIVDIEGLLNLSLTEITENSQGVVIDVENIVAGIKVEDLVDVMFLHTSEITSVPTAIHSVNDEYLQGAAPYRGKMMSILDIPKILLSGDLIVDEAV